MRIQSLVPEGTVVNRGDVGAELDRSTLATRLQVQMPLWQWGARGSTVRAAEADRERVDTQVEQSTEQLALEARYAALNLMQARRNVDLLAKADSVADARYSVAYNRYVIGRITIDILFQAQREGPGHHPVRECGPRVLGGVLSVASADAV